MVVEAQAEVTDGVDRQGDWLTTHFIAAYPHRCQRAAKTPEHGLIASLKVKLKQEVLSSAHVRLVDAIRFKQFDRRPVWVSIAIGVAADAVHVHGRSERIDVELKIDECHVPSGRMYRRK